ncbi:MAG TPA: phosphoribosylanthranilate isomerase [Patescibacteria group bacterium]
MHLFHHSDEIKKDDGKTKVKICGIRRFESAQAAITAGADFLGFNFVNNSHRYINPLIAKEIIERVHKHANIVGVFQDATAEEVNELAHYLKLHYVQLHGNENPTLISKIKVKVLKAVSLPQDFSIDNTIPALQQYNVHHILLDRKTQGQGPMVEFEKAKEIASHLPIFLAGGLQPENVAEAISQVRPFGVDVAGGIEVNGHEHTEKIMTFVQNAKGVAL